MLPVSFFLSGICIYSLRHDCTTDATSQVYRPTQCDHVYKKCCRLFFLFQSAGPSRNVVVGIVCGVLLLIHLLLGLIAHKLDHLENLRLSCVPLCGESGCYRYRVLVKTGWNRGAGTSGLIISACSFSFF